MWFVAFHVSEHPKRMGVQKKEYMKNIVAEALFIGQYIVYFSGYITECSVHKIKKVVITDNN